MKPMELRGRWVLVTGASGGLGREMARELALKQGANLVLAARRADALGELEAELRRAAGIETVSVAVDLSTPSGVERLVQQATEGRLLQGAIINAAVTHFGDWDEQAWVDCERLLQLNVVQLVHLSRLLLAHLVQPRRDGGLMLIGSLAGVSPLPYQSVYSATKAFVNTFGCAMHHEMKPRGVSITTLVPGGIDTDMTAGGRFNALRGWLMPAERCARQAVEAFRQRRYTCSPGLTYQASALLMRAVPQQFLSARLGEQYRRSMLQDAARRS